MVKSYTFSGINEVWKLALVKIVASLVNSIKFKSTIAVSGGGG